MGRMIHLAEDTITRDELAGLAAWIQTGPRLTKGPLCREFEALFADWQGARFAVFVNSGSSANLVVASALLQGGYLRNRKVIAPAVSWCTTVTPFLQLGMDVQLCDCDRDDLGLDLDHFEELCRREQPALAIVVHVLGHANKLTQIRAICERYGVLLVEDSCEALGSEYGGRKCGSHSLAGTFSFYYGHHISTIEGGMVVTDDERLYNLILSIRSHGWSRDVSPEYHQDWTKAYQIDEVRDLYTFYYSGFNLRSTDLNAFLGLSQMKKIDELGRVRARNFQAYHEALKGYWSQTSDSSFLSSFAYGVLAENRMEVFGHLKAHQIEVRPLICGNIGLHPFWIKERGRCSLPHADVIHDYGMYLPNHFNLSLEDIRFVAETFRKVAVPKFI
jgi:CDP-6-deoxy-D-xylo-4-hexulose-3-dehydrase